MNSTGETTHTTIEIRNPGENKFNRLRTRLDGEVFTDNIRLTMYSTDASDYRERAAGTRSRMERGPSHYILWRYCIMH